MLPYEINQWFTNQYGQIKVFKPASGGCINNGGTLETPDDIYFIKWNNSAKLPNMFKAEAQGLDLLRMTDFNIPKVIDLYEGQELDALLLENIPKGAPDKDFWLDFGRKLAKMHQIKAERYGLDHNNYMGSLQQENEPLNHWVHFFIGRRLMPQVSLANANGYFNSSQLDDFEKFYKKLPEILSEERPTLLHGDLWGGNFMINPKGNPVLIDPAVYYGHREVDLAMSKLFGGFESKFYNAYYESFPTTPGLDDRLDIYNLYPLLIHLNLFGAGYFNQVTHIIRRFS